MTVNTTRDWIEFKIPLVDDLSFEVIEFSRSIKSCDQMTVHVRHDFIGVYFNLGTPLVYGDDFLPPGLIRENYFTVAYVPAGTYTIVLPFMGTHRGLALHLDVTGANGWEIDFPALMPLVNSMQTGRPTFLRPPARVTPALQDTLHEMLHTSWNNRARESRLLFEHAYAVLRVALRELIKSPN